MGQNPKQPNLAALMATVVGQVGCLVIVIIGIALGAGMALDKFLETRIFTVLLMLGSVPVALYLTVRLSLTAVKRAQDALQPQDSNNSEEEIDV
ncbi:MAG: AtpZ/AtpI family protein [Chloroflexi bacterium]|nr:AtpZ/AtpI family protein [Chloroflexota bacterium]